MYRKITVILLAIAIVIAPYVVDAVSISNSFRDLWYRLSSTSISLRNSNDTVRIPSLGGSGTQCLQTDDDGDISGTGSACGSGGGSSFAQDRDWETNL